MQGFHMIQNFEIFISEITLFWPDYTTKRITPSIMFHASAVATSAGFQLGRLPTKEKNCELQFHRKCTSLQLNYRSPPDKFSACPACRIIASLLAFPLTIVASIADGKSASLEGLLIKARM